MSLMKKRQAFGWYFPNIHALSDDDRTVELARGSGAVGSTPLTKKEASPFLT